MIPEWLTALSPYFIGAAGLGSGYVVAKVNKGKSRENDIIDQVQEERDIAVEERDKAVADKQKLEDGFVTRLEGLEQREYVLIDYIFTLWAHIHEGKGPPPPTMPEELLGKRKDKV